MSTIFQESSIDFTGGLWKITPGNLHKLEVGWPFCCLHWLLPCPFPWCHVEFNLQHFQHAYSFSPWTQWLAIYWINIRLISTCRWYWSLGYTLQVFLFFFSLSWIQLVSPMPHFFLHNRTLIVPRYSLLSCSQLSSRKPTHIKYRTDDYIQILQLLWLIQSRWFQPPVWGAGMVEQSQHTCAWPEFWTHQIL